MTNEHEQELDALLAVEREREQALAQATAAVEAAKAKHDGSDWTWSAVERAASVVERRRVELSLAQRERHAAELAIAEAKRAELHAERTELADEDCSPDAFARTVEASADAMLDVYLALQRGLEELGEVASDYWSARSRVKELDRELGGTTRVGAEHSVDEFIVAVCARLAMLARARDVAPVDVPASEPTVTDERSRLAAETWREVVRTWRDARREETNEEHEESPCP